jgi:pyruvate,water dikinase
LSHCAIVAREFELPAVVGTQVGTVTIPEGATVEVDGTKGVVTIIESP